MTLKYASTLLLGVLMTLTGITARAEWNDSIRYRAEIGTTIAGGQNNPLWLNANRYGFSSTKRNNLWLRLAAFKDMDEEKPFSWGAGIDMGVAYRFESIFMPQQLYAEVRYRCLDLLVGAKEINDGFVCQDLSSGSLTQGWNARPIPQVRLGVFDYANVWGCKEMFAMKGYIAYGMFTDNWWVKRWANPEYSYALNTLYCSRALYFRFGNARKFPLEGELGIVVDSQFGGKTWNQDGNKTWIKNPTNFKAWVRAMIPLAAGDDNVIGGERYNVEGNFLGNWSMSLKWEDPSGWMVRLYYQHFFEDHSMLFMEYPRHDGLYGVHGRLPKNPFVSEVLYEYLYAKDQSGPVYWDHTDNINYQISGRDEYYDHYIFNGWQHWGQPIANPLFTAPLYNDNHRMYLLSTRIRAHHLGFKGDPTDQLSYRVLLSHTRSWGTYYVPFTDPKSNFSWLAELKYHPKKLKGWEASFSLAADHGSLLGNSFGGMLSIAKTGWF